MTKEELAKMLDGMKYSFHIITEKAKTLMAGTDLVVVIGASDDLMEFRGAINDEVGCWKGGVVYLDGYGLIENDCDDHECPYFLKLCKKASFVHALWCYEPGISWTYKTDIPHATFNIMEDGDIYCRGIVFNLSDAKEVKAP